MNMDDKKEFSNIELLKYLGQFTVNRARCEKCGITAHGKKLKLYHRDGDSSNNSYKNIAIYCEDHHNVIPE